MDITSSHCSCHIFPCVTDMTLLVVRNRSFDVVVYVQPTPPVLSQDSRCYICFALHCRSSYHRASPGVVPPLLRLAESLRSLVLQLGVEQISAANGWNMEAFMSLLVSDRAYLVLVDRDWGRSWSFAVLSRPLRTVPPKVSACGSETCSLSQSHVLQYTEIAQLMIDWRSREGCGIPKATERSSTRPLRSI